MYAKNDAEPRVAAYPSSRDFVARVPFFASGGLGVDNLGDALDAGASRVCVLRAIAGAADPERAARALREQLDARDGGHAS